MTLSTPSLAVVVPCYNEEDVFPITLNTLQELLGKLISSNKIADDSKLYFIDDGSKDSTWSLLKAASENYPNVVGIKLSRNKGHQNALYAGLCSTTEDIVVSIDADLQDDPINIELMIDDYYRGNDVVYGVISKRETDTFFKRFTAEGYYHLMKKMG